MSRSSPLQRAQERMGYLYHTQRDGCGNCVQARSVEPSGALNDRHRLRCIPGGFGTTAFSICNQHQRKDSHAHQAHT
ncbi:MAG: hypothetical protein QM569_14760 [Acidovorax sp.]|uniref:hypothetical protein n=1 Tax=Acidovorax sp. TaxID=1872122 RepID=UPI0039E36DE3